MREVSWDRALGRIGERVRRIEEHGPDAVAMYVGTAADLGAPPHLRPGVHGRHRVEIDVRLGDPGLLNNSPAHAMYGFCFTQPFPDVDHTECLIIVGRTRWCRSGRFSRSRTPPSASRRSRPGGKVIVVDPRRTETAKIASEYVSIRAGSDPFFYLAFVRVLSRGVRSRRPRGGRRLEQVEAAVAPWTPERAAEVTGIPAETLGGSWTRTSGRWCPLYAPRASTWGDRGPFASGFRRWRTSCRGTSIAAVACWWARGSSIPEVRHKRGC